MFWKCPACGDENNNSVVRCTCGYEAVETYNRTKPRPISLSVISMILILLGGIGTIGLFYETAAKYDTGTMRVLNFISGILTISTGIGLYSFKKWVYLAYLSSVVMFMIQTCYLLFIVTEIPGKIVISAITFGYLIIFYLLGRYIKKWTSNLT